MTKQEARPRMTKGKSCDVGRYGYGCSESNKRPWQYILRFRSISSPRSGKERHRSDQEEFIERRRDFKHLDAIAEVEDAPYPI
jgi:hypothetical protein